MTTARQALSLSAAGLYLLLFFSFSVTAAEADIDDDMRLYMQRAIAEAESFADPYDANVWLLDMSTRLSRWLEDPVERLELLQAVHREATRTGLSPELVLAVVHTESTFDRFALSVVGARGYMQIMPFWKDEIGRDEDNLFDMDTNIRYGTTILSYYLKIEKGNLERALGRYNGSLGKRKYPNKVIGRWEQYWQAQ